MTPSPALKKTKMNWHNPWLMLSVAWIFVLFQFFLQLSAGILIPPLTREFHLSALGAGLVAASFYLVYVLLQLPAGILIDAVGPRRLLTGGGLVCGLGCLIFAYATNMGFLLLGRMLMGAGASFAFVSALYLVDHNFPENRFAFIVGIIETVGMFGTLAANIYLAELLVTVPWSTVMLGAAGCAFVLALLSFLIIRDGPEQAAFTPRAWQRFFTNAWLTMKNKKLWANGLYGGLHFSTLTVFATLWGLPYLILSQHIDMPEATIEGSMVFVGVAAGAPLMGRMFETLPHRNRFLLWMALASAGLCAWIIYLTPENIYFSGFLFFLLGFVCSCYVFNYTLANLCVPRGMRSTAVGFNNALVVATAPVLQPFIGWQLNLVSARHNTLGQQLYTLSDYHWALSVMPIVLLLGAAIAFYLPSPVADSAGTHVS